MSKLSPTIKLSQGPGWTVLQGRASDSSDGEIQIRNAEGPSLVGLKKRKSGSERDLPPSYKGASPGPITKRARHGTLNVVPDRRSSVSGHSDSALGSVSSTSTGAGPFSGSDKSVKKTVPSPTRQSTLRISSSESNEHSTASALAALYNPYLGIDPSITRWRGKSRSPLSLKPSGRQLSKRWQSKGGPITDSFNDKWEGKANPLISPASSDNTNGFGFSSSAGPLSNSRVEGTKNTMKAIADLNVSASRVSSGSRHPPLAEQALIKSARKRDEYGPLYINDRRQLARKTTNSLRPVKIYQFNRQSITAGDSGSAKSLSSVSSLNSARSPNDRSNSVVDGDESPTRTKPTGCTSTTQERSRSGTVKGKEKPILLPRSTDVIPIGSSDDEPSVKMVSAAGLSPKTSSSPKRAFLSELKLPRKYKEVQKRHTVAGHKDNSTILNEIYERQEMGKKKASSSSHKQLEQDIIDLTLADSDEVESQPMQTQQKLKEKPPSSGTRKDQVLIPQARSTKRVAAQPPSSIVAPKPIAGPLLSKMVGDHAGTSKLRSTPRPRSVPMISIPDVSAVSSWSQSARASPILSPGRIVSRPHVHPTRQVICSSESDDSGVADEQKGIEAMVDDIPASACEDRMNLRDDSAVPYVPVSSSNASSVGDLQDLIPPLRRSTRHGSASSNDYVPLTDAESPPVSSPSPELTDMNEPPSYGGFKALTWNLYKRNLSNFHFKHYYAKDIPTSLPDSINRLSAFTRRNAGIRDIFRAFILENICDDEGGAPEIEITNEVDAEPSPVFEFNYSNRMWYGEDLTMSDYSELQGCECIGRCDPKSQTCACAIKTRSYLEIDGCVYEKNGRLKHPRYPIFECNDFCSCDDDCRNRVVQHGRKVQLSIKKTQNKGWGVFNGPKRVPKGTFLGVYAGELLTDEQGEVRGRYYNTLGKSYLFDIDFWHLKKGHNLDEWHNKYTVDAYHTGNFTRFLNHSCEPNARLFPCYINEPDVERPLLVVFSNKDIPPHEEICFNYMGSYSEDEGDDDDNDDECESEEEAHGEKRKDAVYRPCMCGARKCKGVMWN